MATSHSRFVARIEFVKLLPRIVLLITNFLFYTHFVFNTVTNSLKYRLKHCVYQNGVCLKNNFLMLLYFGKLKDISYDLHVTQNTKLFSRVR